MQHSWRISWDAKLLNWLARTGIHVGAGIAALLIGATTAMSYFGSPWLLEPNSRPVVYDSSMAYLGAWFFNLLVIEVPRRNRKNVMWRTLAEPLYKIANNPVGLIRDVAFLAHCPDEADPSIEYIEKICHSANSNSAFHYFLEWRMDSVRREYQSVLPYIQELPPEIASLVHQIASYIDGDGPVTESEVRLDAIRRPESVGSGERYERHTALQYATGLQDYVALGRALRAKLSEIYGQKLDPGILANTGLSGYLTTGLRISLDADYPYADWPEFVHDRTWHQDRWGIPDQIDV